jgi:hypothetical protein
MSIKDLAFIIPILIVQEPVSTDTGIFFYQRISFKFIFNRYFICTTFNFRYCSWLFSWKIFTKKI